MILDELIARLVLSRGLVSPERLRALREAHPSAERRPLEQLLLEDELITHDTLAELLKELWGGGSLGGPGAPESAVAAGDPLRGRTHSVDSWDVSAVPSVTGDTTAGLPAAGGALWLSQDRSLIVRSVLGQGGMGVVYLVMDPRLRRLGALKLLRKARDPGRAEARFQREAIITARLDHPGVAPVYEAGRTLQGDAFLLMRYLPGRSLDERIQETYRAEPTPDLEALRPFLQNLVRVCEATAFAHSQGVVHRDLKPANVVLGSYGEVCVVDWGLARDVLQTAEQDAEVRSQLQPEETEAAQLGLTQRGAMLGTLGFMSPEQARGDDVDPKADIFSLGAVLSQILTGRIPFAGESLHEVATATAEGKVLFPAARRADLDPELRAIAARALAPDASRRYHSARALGEDLEAYLQGRPVSVLRYGFLSQGTRFVRKHPALFGGLAAAAVSLVLGVVAIFTVRAEALRAERAQAIARASAAAARAQTKLRPGAKTRSPREAIALALSSLSAAQSWHVLAPDSDAARRRRFEAALELGHIAKAAEQWPLAAQAYEEAASLGVDDARARLSLLSVSDEASAERRRRRAEVTRWLERASSGRLTRDRDGLNDGVFAVIQFPEVASELLCKRLLEISQELLRAEEAYLSSAQRPARGEPNFLTVPGLEAALAKRVASTALSSADEAAIAHAELRLARRILRNSAPSSPEARLGLVRRRLGDFQRKTLGAGKLDAAQLCCAALGRLPRSPLIVDALRSYLRAESDEMRAVTAGLALCRQGADLRVLSAELHFDDGGVFANRIDDFMKAHPAKLPLSSETAAGYGDRGRARVLQGDYQGAIEDITRALELGGARGPLLLTRGLAHSKLGDHERALSDYDAAIAANPKKSARAYSNRSNLQLKLGNLDAAIADSTRAMELSPSAVLPYVNRALAYSRRGDLQAAEADYDRAIALEDRDAERWAARGALRRLRDDCEGALRDLNEAVRLDPESSLAWRERALLMLELGRLEEGLADATRTVALDPRSPEALTTRGLILLRLGDVPGAHADGDQALSLKADHSGALGLRSMCRASQGDERGALSDIDRAIAAEPTNAGFYANRADLRRKLQDLPGALKDCDKAIELNARLSEAWGNRALVKLTLGDLAGADADIAKCVELEPKQAIGWYNRGNIRRARGMLIEALADYSEAISVDPSYALAWANRGYTRAQQGDKKGALVDMKRFLELSPQSPFAPRIKQTIRSLQTAIDAED